MTSRGSKEFPEQKLLFRWINRSIDRSKSSHQEKNYEKLKRRFGLFPFIIIPKYGREKLHDPVCYTETAEKSCFRLKTTTKMKPKMNLILFTMLITWLSACDNSATDPIIETTDPPIDSTTNEILYTLPLSKTSKKELLSYMSVIRVNSHWGSWWQKLSGIFIDILYLVLSLDLHLEKSNF